MFPKIKKRGRMTSRCVVKCRKGEGWAVILQAEREKEGIVWSSTKSTFNFFRM
jgi:hypothetical protein